MFLVYVFLLEFLENLGFPENIVKAKLTVTIEEDLIPVAKRYARSKGVSLSYLIESALREVSAESPLFSERWRGRFVLAKRDEERYKHLTEKYL